MHIWFWPQYTVATLYILSVLIQTHRCGTGKVYTSKVTGGSWVSHLLSLGVVVYALHVGGFW